jgi:predicted methyltransferase
MKLIANSPCRAAFLLAVAAVLLQGCAGLGRGIDYEAIVAAPDRSEADRRTDVRRNPARLLAFAGVKPGMRVLDMGAGAGYSTELIARAVGPTGTVYAQNARDGNEKALAAFQARMKGPAMSRVVPLMRPYDDPVPAEIRDLDLVTCFFAYHDMPHLGVDRARMNRRLFDALKPGGLLVVADHAARPGDGVSVSRTLHRIEDNVLRTELQAAGFRLIGEADFLRNPQDKRDVLVFKSPVPVDEFVLKFQKPR